MKMFLWNKLLQKQFWVRRLVCNLKHTLNEIIAYKQSLASTKKYNYKAAKKTYFFGINF